MVRSHQNTAYTRLNCPSSEKKTKNKRHEHVTPIWSVCVLYKWQLTLFWWSPSALPWANIDWPFNSKGSNHNYWQPTYRSRVPSVSYVDFTGTGHTKKTRAQVHKTHIKKGLLYAWKCWCYTHLRTLNEMMTMADVTGYRQGWNHIIDLQ